MKIYQVVARTDFDFDDYVVATFINKENADKFKKSKIQELENYKKQAGKCDECYDDYCDLKGTEDDLIWIKNERQNCPLQNFVIATEDQRYYPTIYCKNSVGIDDDRHYIEKYCIEEYEVMNA